MSGSLESQGVEDFALWKLPCLVRDAPEAQVSQKDRYAQTASSFSPPQVNLNIFLIYAKTEQQKSVCSDDNVTVLNMLCNLTGIYVIENKKITFSAPLCLFLF